MKWVYKTLRALFVACLALAVLVPVGLYIAFSMPGVQNSLRRTAESRLTELAGMDVSIGDVYLAPFNRVTLRHVTLTDTLGDTAVCIDRLGAGVSIPRLLFKHSIVMTYAEIIGLDARLKRDSAGAPLNIQPMIDALAPKNSDNKAAKFDFRVNTVVIRKSSFSYDVISEPIDSTGRFDKNHIGITDLRADLRLPRIANNDFNVIMQRLALNERSGICISGLNGEFHVGDTAAHINGFDLYMPHSHIGLNDISTTYPSLKNIRNTLSEIPLNVKVAEGSFINPADMAPFLPALSRIDNRFSLAFEAHGTLKNIIIDDIDISSTDKRLWLRGEGHVSGIDGSNPNVDLPRIGLGCGGDVLADIIAQFTKLPQNATQILHNLGNVNLLGEAEASENNGHFSANLITDAGDVTIGAHFENVARGGKELNFAIDLDDTDGKKIFDGTGGLPARIGNFSAAVLGTATLWHDKTIGNAKIDIKSIEYGAHTLNDIDANIRIDGKYLGAGLFSENPGLSLQLEAEAVIDPKSEISLNTSFRVDELAAAFFTDKPKFAGCIISGAGLIDLSGNGIDDVSGLIKLSGLRYASSAGDVTYIGDIQAKAETDSAGRKVTLRSDIVDADITGNFRFSEIVAATRRTASEILPDLLTHSPVRNSVEMNDSLALTATVKTSAPLAGIISLPVSVIYPVKLSASYLSTSGELRFNIDAPYLQQGNRLLENTTLSARIIGDKLDGQPTGSAAFSTIYPTKKGDMTLGGSIYAANNQIDTRLQWRVNRDREFSGNLSLSATFGRDSLSAALVTLIDINPGEMVFNDTTWLVSPAKIEILPERISVDGFRVGRQGQYLEADGIASALQQDSVTIALRDVNLDYVFETLDIPTAMFGGIASGDLYACSALSQEPRLYTDNLNVKALSYNHSLMGDTRIKSHWDAPSKAVVIDAIVAQPNGHSSKIDGKIMPLSDSLDFFFDADKIEVGFMKPFMEGFTSQVSGYASGKARLWGSFKYIDMVGDIFAEDLKLKLDFTNTIYSATDSVKLEPGHIALNNITLRDKYGNTATLNGWLDHEYFKKPKFNFRITGARNMLVYDVKENHETNWYGRIFGNGGATVTGEPGIVNIGVDMSTAPNSTFTFVLSDAEFANDYTFITFRDRDQAKKDSIAAATAPPAIVQELKKRIAGIQEDGSASDYNMNIAVNVTPDAQINLVMDPVGGDRIRAYGNGNLRLTYESSSEDLKMFGTYTLQRGNYNFTLQDIIIKDFTIRDGSSISFHGDPFAAQLDIEAAYSLNANLSDLDESFLEDRELSRTNVPVNALMIVTGDIRQPDISFDLEFPTLTSDTYRKVKSIVSTEDMMNRQIIYLLALNRFYTPDYMLGATKGNELVSVASSTISSQLSSILGQLSDNWSLAPNFRSDRGDFSDVEVDLALSSHLLNNRLLLNGNFGYRDKTLNNNAFVGDFDIEYLLNRSGNIRLKAYNRYNDRNFYVKSALTTQGVGMVFKRDFDNIFSFLRRPRKRKQKPQTETDTLVNITDSIVIKETGGSADTTKTEPAPRERDADWLIFR
jgi:hypothetical protein